MELLEHFNKIKLWWLAAILAIVSAASSKVFYTDTKLCKAAACELDSLALRAHEIDVLLDSAAIIHSSVMGERDALSKQLDRNASQQIIIDKRTTNITKQYIIDTTKVK